MRIVAVFGALALLFTVAFSSALTAAPYAAVVIDARTGEVLHARNADTRLHPASLTKMMTLYIAFDAVERGEISLDTKVTVSRKAASEPPSKLGLKPGQKIALRYLIRAAAVKSANDAATAIAEAIAGSEAAFAKRMNETARRLGMKNSHFVNAHGLTQRGHYSSARDMTLLGRRLFFDFPAYYNLFSRRSTFAGVREVANTNRKFLAAYRGADGIKTGYTNAAGWNLVASARRGDKHVIATVFGGHSAAWRNRRVAELLDMGFKRSRPGVQVRRPKPVDLSPGGVMVASSGAVAKSLRPRPRPERPPAADAQLAAIEAAVLAANREAMKAKPRPAASQSPSAAGAKSIAVASAEQPLRVVTRISTSGNRLWSVQVGAFVSRHEAEKALLQTALREVEMLDDATREIGTATIGGHRRYVARFSGLTQAEANLTCARIRARHSPCAALGPSS